MSGTIGSPRDALVYVDFMATFSTDPSTSAQFRGLGNVIRSLARKAEEAALHMERQEAVIANGANGDVVELLRGIRTVMAARPDGHVFAQVCKQAADEIEWLRWESRNVK